MPLALCRSFSSPLMAPFLFPPNGLGGLCQTRGRTDAPNNVAKSLRTVDQEAEQIQELLRRRNSPVDPRDRFGSIAAKKVHMPQTERIYYGFQPDVWNEGAQIERLLHERQNAFMADDERVEDEFAEGRVPQIVEPAQGTCPGLKKHARIQRKRREWRTLMKAERKRKAVATDPGCV
ncbi:hypothetical protein niasHT_036999 [Heterodera trifolii]|uniref:Uncharacterized protein n=1 Tax=Heterodera trifolii TaxID=157864 RepID=A0ABD2IBB4_9BILA